MAKISRTRGASYEREVANLFKDWGHEAYRTAQHMGKTGKAPDVVVKGLHLECKRRRSVAVYEWYEQAKADALAEGKGNLPTVIFRGDNKPTMVMMHFEDFIQLYNEWINGKELNNGNTQEQNYKDTERQATQVPHDPQEGHHHIPGAVGVRYLPPVSTDR